jgi:hypothetical protein
MRWIHTDRGLQHPALRYLLLPLGDLVAEMEGVFSETGVCGS